MQEYLEQLIRDTTPTEAAKLILDQYHLTPTNGMSESLREEIWTQIDLAKTSEPGILSLRCDLIAALLTQELDHRVMSLHPLINKLRTSENTLAVLEEIQKLL